MNDKHLVSRMQRFREKYKEFNVLRELNLLTLIAWMNRAEVGDSIQVNEVRAIRERKHKENTRNHAIVVLPYGKEAFSKQLACHNFPHSIEMLDKHFVLKCVSSDEMKKDLQEKIMSLQSQLVELEKIDRE